MAHSGSGVTGLVTKHAHVSGSRQHSGIAAGGGPKAGYTAWYDASAITGVADGVALSSWPDLSGNNYNLAQATGAKQPTYYKTTAGQLQNGKPVVVFNGSSHDMSTGATLAPMGSTVLVQIVVSDTTVASTATVFNMQNGPALSDFSGNWQAGGSGSVVNGTAVTTGMHVVTAYLPFAGTALIRLDQTQIGSASNIGGTSGNRAVFVGSDWTPGNYWPGKVCELVYYSAFGGSAADYQANEAYLKAKWGTP